MKKLMLMTILVLCGCSAAPKPKPEPPTAASATTVTVVSLPGPVIQSATTGAVGFTALPYHAETNLTDKQKIDLLRAEAHKRGLRWYVVCEDYEDPDKQFFAFAEDKRQSKDAGQYIEEGALPWWYENGPTQAEAAYRLYLSIQQPANVTPEHKPKEGQHHKKVCPPELRGD